MVCQLTGLRCLHLTDQGAAEGLLQRLTVLQCLTQLHYLRGPDCCIDLSSKVRLQQEFYAVISTTNADSNPTSTIVPSMVCMYKHRILLSPPR